MSRPTRATRPGPAHSVSRSYVAIERSSSIGCGPDPTETEPVSGQGRTTFCRTALSERQREVEDCLRAGSSWSAVTASPPIRRQATRLAAVASTPRTPAALPSAHSQHAPSSTMATGRAATEQRRPDGARSGSAGMDRADTPRTRSPVHQAARSTDAQPAPDAPTPSTPAPAAPSPAPRSARDPAVARRTSTGTSRRQYAVPARQKPPWSQRPQTSGTCEECESDGRHVTRRRHRDVRRTDRCTVQPEDTDGQAEKHAVEVRGTWIATRYGAPTGGWSRDGHYFHVFFTCCSAGHYGHSTRNAAGG